MASRQARWQAKQRALGRCPVCGGKAKKGGRCATHWKAQLTYNRESARRSRARKKGLTDGLSK
jgi:hypothetical protein